jgi:hypothetical protein
MRGSHKLVLLSTVSLAALAAGGAAARADTVCAGSLTGTIAGNLVVPAGGSCTLYQANVSGNVRVSQNASLTVNGLEEWSSIGGNVIANACASTLLEGTVTVGGNVQIQNCTGTSGFAGPGIKINGNFQCQDNSGACEAALGEVRGNAQVQNNSSATASDVSLNAIGGNLQCQGNTAAPTHALGGEWVVGNLLGQCAANLGFAAAPYPCGSLTGLSLPDTTISLAQVYSAGEVITGTTTAPVSLCRVVGNIMPSTNPAGDSNINFEVWMPTADWTGRYEQVGNGGFAGSIEYGPLKGAAAINNATASTDDGSSQPPGAAPGSFALGHTQRINDYGYRAVHRTDLNAELIVSAFYGGPPAHNYFNGCSKGGEEALMELQRYPDDFDGILGGAPASNFVVLLSDATSIAQQLTNPYNPNGFIPSSDLLNITNAVQTACVNAKTVATDNFLGNPTQCTFNPQTIFASFLTPAQITALSNVYSGIVTDVGAPPFNVGPGLEPGNETQLWAGINTQTSLTTPPTSTQYFFGNGAYTQFLQQPAFNTILEFNVSTSPQMMNEFPISPASPGSAEQTIGSALTANSTDLSRFKAHGGKIIQYQGYADQLLPSGFSLQHYNAVVASEGQGYSGAQSYYRLFMAPGMGHCGGGPGLNSFGNVTSNSGSGPASSDIYTALETWVEQGIAPTQVIATNTPSTFTRPLCPYPQNATYTGTGSTNDAANFVCR